MAEDEEVVLRKVFRKKIYADKPKSGETPKADVDRVWIEVERTKELRVARCRKNQWQATTYKFNWPERMLPDGDESEDGEDVNNKYKKTVLISPLGCKMRILKQLAVDRCRKNQWQRTVYKIDNSAANEARKTHVKRVVGSDQNSTIDIEVIDSFKVNRCKKQQWQQTKFKMGWHVKDETNETFGDVETEIIE